MRTKLEKMRTQLEEDRSSFMSHWRDLGEYILPRRPRFVVTDANKGDRRNHKIVDSTATFAARTLASGMTSGITSPARPWFKLTTSDPDASEDGAVKRWLSTVQSRMNTVLSKSNLYEVLPSAYADMGVFGTAVIFAEEDFDQVVRFWNIPLGSYYLGDDARGRANILVRDLRFTVRQLLEKFPGADLTTATKSLIATGALDAWVEICHAVFPADEPGRFKFKSVYYERASNGTKIQHEDKTYLRESGYEFCPFFALRWGRTGEDIYGTDCPGMVALGDVKALQILQKRKAQAVEKMVNPPMIAPPELRTEKMGIGPGELTYYGGMNQAAIRPMHDVALRIDPVLIDIKAHQDRIQKAFFADLFLMMSNDDRAQRATATEINERREEKLLALGPVLEQLNQDLLDPLVDLVYAFMDRQGMIPLPPEALQGVPLKVEYLSVMAQAQKLINVAGIERFQTFLLAQMQLDPQAADAVDVSEMLATYGDITSVPPGIVRPREEVEAIRAERNKAAQAQAMVEQLPKAANALANAPMDGDNALTRMLGQAQAGAIAPRA